MKLEFCRQIFEKYSSINFMKICLAGSELFHADGGVDRRTDMTKLIVAFSNFANAPKNGPTVRRNDGVLFAQCLAMYDIRFQ